MPDLPQSVRAAAREWAAGPGRGRGPVHAAALAVFALTAAVALLAQQADRPITAAIVILLGVTIVGALEGVFGGLAAALLASAVYNFFLAEPTFRFTLSSIEDLVPLLAFNVSAVASAVLTGRLRDRAAAAEIANRRLAALLDLSRRLQAAFNPEQVLAALEEHGAGSDVRYALHLVREGALVPVGTGPNQGRFARQLCDSGLTSLHEPQRSAFLLLDANEPMGALVASLDAPVPPGAEAVDAGAIANLASIALGRCLLLERLSRAELVHKSEAFKTALLSSVSHDLRTPLGAISASASSLARYGGDLPESARADMLHMIQEQCRRLDRYTANLLSLSRLQAGLDAQAFTICDAREALGAAVAQARTLDTGHDFVKRFEPADALVRADPVMLEQLFYNVIENAVRYSPPGTAIQVTAEFRGGRLLVSIRDFGPGIGGGDPDRLFDRFYRAADANAPAGSGLGLAIAKGLTEAFGGRIAIGTPDDADGGTVVTIGLPLAAAAGSGE